MRCQDLMKTPVWTCNETDSIVRCAELMRDHNIGFVPITETSGRVVGTVTDRDLVIRGIAERRSYAASVGFLMTHHLVTVRPEDDISVAEARMGDARKSRILVVDADNKCKGIISLSDIAQHQQDDRTGRLLRKVTARESSSTMPAAEEE